MRKEKDLYKGLKPFLNCKDYTVSGDSFEVMINQNYHMLVTSPVPEDIENYYKSENYISHTDSNKSLFDKVYQFVKKKALKRKLKMINSFKLSKKTILDVGAGTGDFLKVCENDDWNVFGVEPSFDAREIAKQKGIILEENIKALSDKKFDVITLWHVLEHVQNLQEFIVTLKSLLKPEGKIVVAVPNYKSYDAKYYKKFWAAFDVPRHLWHFSQCSIHKLFSEANMLVEDTLPMKFDSFYVSLLSEKYKTGKMNPVNAFYRGLLSNVKARASSQYSSLIYIIKNY